MMDYELYCVDEAEKVNRCKNQSNKAKNKPYCNVDTPNKCTKVRKDGLPWGYKPEDGIVNRDEQVYGTAERVNATVERLRTLRQEEEPTTSGLIPVHKSMTKSQAHLAAIKANIPIHPKATITKIASKIVDENLARTTALAKEARDRQHMRIEKARSIRELVSPDSIRIISDEEQNEIERLVNPSGGILTDEIRKACNKEYYIRRIEGVIYRKYKQRKLDLSEKGKVVIRDYIEFNINNLMKANSVLSDRDLISVIKRFPSELNIAVMRYHLKELVKRYPGPGLSEATKMALKSGANKMTEKELNDLTTSSFFRVVKVSPEFEYYEQQIKSLGSTDTAIVSSTTAHNPRISYVPMKLIENRNIIRELYRSYQ